LKGFIETNWHVQLQVLDTKRLKTSSEKQSNGTLIL